MDTGSRSDARITACVKLHKPSPDLRLGLTDRGTKVTDKMGNYRMHLQHLSCLSQVKG